MKGASISEARLEALAWALGSSADLVLVVTLEGRVVYANDAARARSPEVTPGAAAETLFPEGARAQLRAAMASVVEHEAATSFEWGEPKGAPWYGATLSPLREGASVTGFLCTSTDATERRRCEIRLRHSEELMVDTQGVAHLGTWEWDLAEAKVSWSEGLFHIYGLTPETYEPSYEAYLAMIHPDDRQRVMEATNRVFHEHIPFSHDERIFRADGSMRYLHTWAHPVLDASGKLARLVGVCQDVTVQKLAEEEVRQLNADLEQRVADRTRTIERTMRDLEAFNAMVSHDLRAPLAVIQMGCAVALHPSTGPIPARVTESLARIERSVVYMTELINDLLALAHVGNAPLGRAEIDVSAMCQDIITNLRTATPERDAVVNVEPGLRCFGDDALIRSALANLLGNAWKYSSRVEQARIEVGAAAREGSRALFVRDNGAGFDMSEAHRLFAPFERLHKASEFEGTGVGLAAVHRIVERHGGRIWAESEPGQGATFYLALPSA